MTRFESTRPIALVALVAGIVLGLSMAGAAAVSANLLTGKDIKNNSLKGKDVKDASLTGKDVKTDSLEGVDVKDGSLSNADLSVYYVVVKADQTVHRSSGGVTIAFSNGGGQTTINFGRTVRDCAYSATVGPTAAEFGIVPGIADVAPSQVNPQEVFVQTYEQDGVGAAKPFHLVVVC